MKKQLTILVLLIMVYLLSAQTFGEFGTGTTSGSTPRQSILSDQGNSSRYPSDAIININPGSVTFSSTVVGATLTRTVSITNQGSTPLVISGITPTGPFTATNPGTIEVGQTSVSTISFMPNAAGNATGSITFNIEGAFSGVNTVQLTGSTYTAYSTIYQNFDASTTMPQDWSTIAIVQNSTSFVHVHSASFDAHSGLNFIKMYNGGEDNVNAKLFLVSPGVNQLSNNVLTYYAKSSWGQATDTMILGTMSNPQDPASFTPLQSINLTNLYQQFSFTFNASNTDKFIAFKHGLGNAQNYAVYIDDISWEADSIVPNPAVAVYPASASTDIRIKFADKHLVQALTWSNGGGNPTGYKFYFGETPALELISNMDLNNVNEYALDLMLDYNTTYYWKIVPYNLDGDAIDCPTWTFTTLSDPTITINATSFLNEGFESSIVGYTPLGWEMENLNTDSAIWSTIGNSSGSINSHTGTKAMHIPFGFLTPHNDWLYTPPLQLHANATYKLDFWYNSIPFPGDACAEKLDVQWGTLPTASSMTNQLFYNDNITNDTYIHYEQNFTPTADGKYFVGFHAFSDPIQFILLIDDIKVTMVSSANEDLVGSTDTNTLLGSYPNPFSPQTVINYQVKGNEQINIDIYNARGQKVRTLVNAMNAKGKHEVTWDGKDDNAQNVANGIYFCKMQSGTRNSVLKLLKLK